MVNPSEYLRRGGPRSSAKHHGITIRKRPKPYLVKFKINKRTIYVGSFATITEAEAASQNYWKAYDASL